MDIKYLGHSSFFIKGKEAKLVTDPFEPKFTGLKFSKTEADIVTVSHQHKDHNYLEGISDTPLVIEWPGQYEKKGMRVYGFKSYHDKKQGAEKGENTIFRVEDEGLAILHCGDLGFVPDDKFLDELGEIDILMVPVGGGNSLDAEEAVSLIKKVEPSVVIPMHYDQPGLNKDIFKLAPLSEFLKEIGAENTAPVQKLTIKKEELEEQMKVVVMEISN